MARRFFATNVTTSTDSRNYGEAVIDALLNASILRDVAILDGNDLVERYDGVKGLLYRVDRYVDEQLEGCYFVFVEKRLYSTEEELDNALDFHLNASAFKTSSNEEGVS